MQLQPISRAESPGYPTRREFLTQRDTLLEHVPARWSKTKGLLGAVTIFVAANLCTGCGPAAKSSNAPDESNPFYADRDSAVVEQAASWTRSIFEKRHFAMGCIAMMPPRHVSEDAVK
jgi:hypothetical protein